MPPAVNSIHIIFTLLATGLLFGLGFTLAQLIVAWPTSRVAGVAVLVGLMILVVAWLVP